MKVNDLVKEGIVGKTVEINYPELLTLVTHKEEGENNLKLLKEKAEKFSKYAAVTEWLRNTIIFLDKLTEGVDGLVTVHNNLFVKQDKDPQDF